MVDALASQRAGWFSQSANSGTAPALTWRVGNDASILTEYQRLSRAGATVSPSQSGAWVGAWLRHVAPDHLIAIAEADKQPIMALALEIERQGPLKVAQFMGGRHACGNFPPVTTAHAVADLVQLLELLKRAISKRMPDIDVLSLERLTARYDGITNPLLSLPHLPSPNLALAVDLTGGFDGVLGRSSGKRKKKKHRSQTRKFEAVGPFRRIRATTPAEVKTALDAFFAMKEIRFRQKGIEDVFSDPKVRAFFIDLFTSALTAARPSFVMHGLEVAGTLRAVTGSSVADNRLVCEFGAITEDELAHASPGDFLFFDNIREACDDGFAVYDFSVGDEPYKRQWCDIEIVQYDAFVPLTMRGYALAAVMRAQNRAKSLIKNNPLVWKMAKALRKRTAATTPAEDED